MNNAKLQLEVGSPTSIKCGHIEWFALDTKLVGKIKVLLKENKELKERIGNAIEYIESNDLYTQDIDYDYDDNMVLSPPTDELERKELLNILRGENDGQIKNDD